MLVTGETGTGKELAARAIHTNSPRAARPFVAINCAALTESLLESELFGHERGAFTGAVGADAGQASRSPTAARCSSTKSASMPLALQAKLLRVLQEREFERVGGTRPIKVDVRLIAATNRDLDGRGRRGPVPRRICIYRLNVVRSEMPPLRDRRAGHPGCWPALPRTLVAGKGGRHVIGISRRRMRLPARLRLAGQRPRARERHRARSRPRFDRRDSPGRTSRRRRRSRGGPCGKRRPVGNFHAAVHRDKRKAVMAALRAPAGNYTASGPHARVFSRTICTADQEPGNLGLLNGGELARMRVPSRARGWAATRCVRHLVSGGMGEVYRALGTRISTSLVALKTVAEQYTERPAVAARFERERRVITSAGTSAHLPGARRRVRGSGSRVPRDGAARGGTAGAPARTWRRYRFEQAMGYAIEIADALSYAHGHAVIHRDLKPANVFLTSTGATVLDFGLAKVRSGAVKGAAAFRDTVPLDVSQPGALIGSTPYMPPERLDGVEADTRSDIFAFGAVVYEMVSGRRAFPGDSAASTIAAMMTADPQPLNLQHPKAQDLKWIIRRCLAKSPEDQMAGDRRRARAAEAGGRQRFRPRATTAAQGRVVAAAGAGAVLTALAGVGADRPAESSRTGGALHRRRRSARCSRRRRDR